ERLGVRVVHPEDAHAVPDPESHHIAKRDPEAGRVAAVEVDRIDVLVLLGRILRVADRSVGAMPEPLWVFGHPRVIRAALQSVVERDLEARSLRGSNELVEIVDGPEIRVHGRMAT